PSAQPVLFFDLPNLLLNIIKVAIILLHLVIVLAGDIGAAQLHQVIDILTGLINKTANSAVGYFIRNKGNGTQMQANQLTYVAHPFVERQPQPTEDPLYPLGPDSIMAVEGPTRTRHKFLRNGLGNIVHDGRPAQPETTARLGHTIQYFKRVPETIFMAHTSHFFNTVQLYHLGKKVMQQSCFKQKRKTNGGL